MKTIQKITLALLTMVSVSSLSASQLEIANAGAATVDAIITGDVKKTGAGALTISAAIAGDLEVNAGSVVIAVNAVASSLDMTGGDLSCGAFNVPATLMSSPATLTSTAAGNLGVLTGTQKMTLAGAFDRTLGANASATPMDISGYAVIGAAGSVLPTAATAVKSGGKLKFAGAALSSIAGATTVESGGEVEVAAAVDTVPLMVDASGSLAFAYGSKITLGAASVWSIPVTAS